MSALAEEITAGPTPEPAGDGAAAGRDAGAPPSTDWQTDGRNRKFVKAPDGHPLAEKGGTIYRRGDETVAEALERTARPDQDKKPPKPRAKKLPKRETNEPDLKTVEAALAQVFTAPGQVAGMLLQDQWLLLHFQARGPELARALVNAAEHNPWLRKKLLELAAGGAAAMQLQAIILLALAAAGYAIPPLAYLLGWEIPPMVQVAVLGGPIPQRNRPAPAQQPVAEANVTPSMSDYAFGATEAS